MPKVSPAINNFNGGLVSPLFEGRTDLPNYNTSCSVLENFVPLIQGPVVKRPGTVFVEEVKDSTRKVRLIPFQFNIEQAYVLEFGHEYIRFYTNGSRLESGGLPIELATDYQESELFELQFAQTADLLYIVHPNHPVTRLTRTSLTTFTLTDIEFFWPPFLDENIDTTSTLTVTGGISAGDSVTVTAVNAIFDAAHVGGYLKISAIPEAIHDEWLTGTSYTAGDFVYYEGNIYEAANTGTSGTRPPVHLIGAESDGGVTWNFHNDGAGYLAIDGFTSSNIVTGQVIVNLPNAVTNTFRWSFASWSDFQGYPRAVAFFENRLVFGGTAKQAQTVWGSVTDAYEDFKFGTEDADAFTYTINTNQVNTIQWLAPSRVLAIGTAGGEFIATGGNINNPITPTSIRMTRQTAYGSAHILPVQVGPDILFVQRSKRKVREYRFSFEVEAYEATDLTIFADTILEGDVVEAQFQQEPSRIIWYPQNDGTLTALTFERVQSVVSWHKHVMGGTDVEVESIAVIPHPDGDVDQLWLSIKRTVNGVTVRYVERMEKLFIGDAEPVTAAFSDSAVIYSGAATDTVTGLAHLEGESVVVVADGALVKPDPVVTGGQITLSKQYTDITVGLPYEARLQTLRTEAGSADGTAQGKTGRIHNLTMRVKSAGAGIFYGTNFDDMAEVHLRTTNDEMDEPIPLATRDLGPFNMPSGYEKPNRIAIKHDSPLPFTLIALYPQMHKQDR